MMTARARHLVAQRLQETALPSEPAVVVAVVTTVSLSAGPATAHSWLALDDCLELLRWRTPMARCRGGAGLLYSRAS